MRRRSRHGRSEFCRGVGPGPDPVHPRGRARCRPFRRVLPLAVGRGRRRARRVRHDQRSQLDVAARAHGAARPSDRRRHPGRKADAGTGACAISDALALTRHALAHGCAGVLMLPPFYYKGMPDEGLYAFIAGVIDRIASPALKIYLYHIPPVAQVGWSLELVGRLIRAYPDTVVGLKDSSGDWQNTAALLERYPGFAVFPGSEVFLLAGLRKGAAGCITATGNINVRGIRRVWENWRGQEADALQAEITLLRQTMQAYPMVPALKRVVAHFRNDPNWAFVRPPMLPLGAAQSAALLADLAKLGFALGERRQAA